jgi:ketosteroid isomerase-like protein
MKKSVLRQWFAVLLLVSGLVWWSSVGIRGAAAMDKGLSAPAPSNDPTAIAAIKQVSWDMGDAMVAGDVQKLNQIYADDWAEIGSSGEVDTKENLFRDFKSFHDKLEWYALGPIDVQVFGNVAVAQGSVSERRSRDGKDTSGEFAWQDLLEKRDGKWVVLRSAGAKVVWADSPQEQSQGPAVVETIKQLERDMGDAMVAVNIDKLNQILADDWATIGRSGKIVTKESVLRDFKSGKDRLVSYEAGPVDAQVFGNVAVAHGGVTEKRIRDGKDISGEAVYMDLLKKRDGKWVVVRTAGASVN